MSYTLVDTYTNGNTSVACSLFIAIVRDPGSASVSQRKTVRKGIITALDRVLNSYAIKGYTVEVYDGGSDLATELDNCSGELIPCFDSWRNNNNLTTTGAWLCVVDRQSYGRGAAASNGGAWVDDKGAFVNGKIDEKDKFKKTAVHEVWHEFSESDCSDVQNLYMSGNIHTLGTEIEKSGNKVLTPFAQGEEAAENGTCNVINWSGTYDPTLTSSSCTEDAIEHSGEHHISAHYEDVC